MMENIRGKGIRDLSVLMNVLVVVWCLGGCSGEEKEKQAQQAAPMEEQEKAGEADEENARDGTVAAGEDLGTPCENHEYTLAPGDSVALEFEMALNRTVYDVPPFAERKIEQADIELIQSVDCWEKEGAGKELLWMDMQSVNTPATVWAVDASRLLAEYESSQGGRPASIEGRMDSEVAYRILFVDGGKAVLDSLGNTGPVDKVAGLSQEEVYERLGGNGWISHRAPSGRTYELPLEQIPVEKINYFLKMSFQVALPALYEQKNVGCESWYRVKTKGAEDAAFALKFTFDKNVDGLFHVFGPDHGPECEQG